jgi:tetratricopeptide (TPR) repeat protein
MKQIIGFLIIAATAISCGKNADKDEHPVVISLLGKSFFEPERPAKVQAMLDSNLAIAKTNWMDNPTEDNYIWYGRRLGYLSHFQEAVDVFTQGLEKYPNSAKLYRHRGHRFISLRRFDRAIEDFNIANSLIPGFPFEVEPDGTPNRINKPLSSTQFNIRYHLGLAHYLKGDFALAQQAFVECLKTCNNDDLLIACVDWMYMTYQRQGKKVDAQSILGNVKENMTIVENDSYYKRCLMYQGKISPDSLLRLSPSEEDADLVMATQGYGVGNWYLYNRDSAKAREIFEKVVAGKYFAAFGFIAAEAELARWKK